MISEWIQKVEQDADLQFLLLLIGSGLLIFFTALTIIIIRYNRKKHKAKDPKEPLEVKVQSTHFPEEEQLSEKESTTIETSHVESKKMTETVIEENKITEEIVTPTETLSVTDNVTLFHQSKADEPDIIKEMAEANPKPIQKEVLSTVYETSMEEKKKSILQAIEQTKSREENLRLLEERLRELRGEEPITIKVTDRQTITEETEAVKTEVETVTPTEIISAIQTSLENSLSEEEEEYHEPFHPDFDYLLTDEDQTIVEKITERIEGNATIEEVMTSETTVPIKEEEEIEVITDPFVQESAESLEKEPSHPTSTPFIEPSQPGVTVSRTFSEWLSTITGKK
ncbi:MAG: hypothetical protein LC101_12255 [Flavobacteriales bacterium]|nr:hypothetical protein [Flavobacteriales bacterium]MCZ2444536.1 hypothetical protein [Flavobacteriales bacterium]